jgi:hypothetical protein
VSSVPTGIAMKNITKNKSAMEAISIKVHAKRPVFLVLLENLSDRLIAFSSILSIPIVMQVQGTALRKKYHHVGESHHEKIKMSAIPIVMVAIMMNFFLSLLKRFSKA